MEWCGLNIGALGSQLQVPKYRLTLMNKILLLVAIIASSLAGACNETPQTDTPKPEAQIEWSPASLTFSSEAASAELTIEADCDWGISSLVDWCKISRSGGIRGTTKLKVTVTENRGSEVRTTELMVKSGDTYKYIPVRQNYLVEAVEVADEAFMAALIAAYDVDGDGVLSSVEAEPIRSIDVPSAGIASLEGVAQFPNIESIDCSGNRLTTLDISSLPKLRALNCKNNQLTSLNIRLNPSLETLDCTGNPLTEILVWTGFKAPKGFVIPEGAVYVEPEIPTPAGYRMVWQDEFNSAGRSLPDNSKWWYETGGGGWGNNEKQTYVSGRRDRDTVALVSDGTLKITAKKVGSEVLSVRMNTVESWTYGYFEASLKLPVGKGTWPAFWMMPKNFTRWPGDGEIDIMEHVGYHPNYVSSSIHCQAYYHSIGTQKTNEIFLSTAQKEFHTYACEWTADYIRFFFDGELHFTFHNDGKGNYDTWPFFNPFYLKLNLAWGGNWGGAMGLDESCLPATYEIDYVRVFKKE